MKAETVENQLAFETCLVRATMACRRVQGAITEMQIIASAKDEAQVQAWALLYMNLQSFMNLLTIVALESRKPKHGSLQIVGARGALQDRCSDEG